MDNLYDVRWEDGNQLKIKSGELRGYLDVRDGNEGSSGGPNGIVSPNYKGIPYYQKKLNEFVGLSHGHLTRATWIPTTQRASASGILLETGHAHGYGYGPAATDGIRFFTIIDGKQPMSSADFVIGAVTAADIYNLYNGMTAKNFTISRDILDDFNLIAASSAPGEAGNIEVLNQLLAYRRNDDMFAEGAPEDFMKSLVATLGIDTEQAGNYENNQRVVVDQIFNRRLQNQAYHWMKRWRTLSSSSMRITLLQK